MFDEGERGMGNGERMSEYIGRWRHKTILKFRVWPKWKKAHEAILKETIIPINGIRINAEGKPELWHQVKGTNSDVFELTDDDFDLIASIPKADARIAGEMVVHAPGTANERVKKECWVEVPVEIYPNAFKNKITPWGKMWNRHAPHEIFGETVEDALGLAGMMGSKWIFIECDDEIDEDIIFKEAIENNAFIVLNHRSGKGIRSGVSMRAGRELVERAHYWVVPGREPWEEGGLFRGYQFPDRILRWTRRIDPANREANKIVHLEKMHERVRAKGRATRETYFLENVVTRFAERVGMSRQRVMARFLDDGVVDWLMRSVGNIKPILARDADAMLRARVTDAVNALEFYYRAVESLQRKEAERLEDASRG